MGIRLVRESIPRQELIALAKEYYEEMIKGVVDLKREVIALGGEMHSDAEAFLLEDGSEQSDLWGFNILLEKPVEDCLVYESFINVRPKDGNRSLEVQDRGIRDRIRNIILAKVEL